MATLLEKSIQDILVKLGYRVKKYKNNEYIESIVYTQFPEKSFILDFVLLDKKICIEADGTYWHSGLNKLHDYNRDNELRKLGWKVLRFKDSTINKYPELVASQIKRGIELLNM